MHASFLARRFAALQLLAASSLLAASLASASVTIVVDQIGGTVPDADGFLEGNSDPFARIYVDNVLAGQTPILDGTNFPSWPGQYSLYLPLDPNTNPTVTILIELYDDDNVGPNTGVEFLGSVQYTYNWVPAIADYQSLPYGSPLGGTYQMGARFQAVLDPVAAEESSWGRTKALYRD